MNRSSKMGALYICSKTNCIWILYQIKLFAPPHYEYDLYWDIISLGYYGFNYMSEYSWFPQLFFSESVGLTCLIAAHI